MEGLRIGGGASLIKRLRLLLLELLSEPRLSEVQFGPGARGKLWRSMRLLNLKCPKLSVSPI